MAPDEPQQKPSGHETQMQNSPITARKVIAVAASWKAKPPSSPAAIRASDAPSLAPSRARAPTC